jgi:hypothetical protein
LRFGVPKPLETAESQGGEAQLAQREMLNTGDSLCGATRGANG